MTPEDLNPPAVVGEAIAGRSAMVRKHLKNLAANMVEQSFDLIDLFYEAQENDYPRQWGYANLGDYAEKELGIKTRTAQWMARAKRVWLNAGLKREHCEPAGKSKVREITSLNPEGSYFNPETKHNEPLDEHIASLMAEAPDMTFEEVKKAVNRLKGWEGENAMHPHHFSCSESAWRVIEMGVDKVRARLGSQGRDEDGNAIEVPLGRVIELVMAEIVADQFYGMEDQPQELVADEDPGEPPPTLA